VIDSQAGIALALVHCSLLTVQTLVPPFLESSLCTAVPWADVGHRPQPWMF